MIFCFSSWSVLLFQSPDRCQHLYHHVRRHQHLLCCTYFSSFPSFICIITGSFDFLYTGSHWNRIRRFPNISTLTHKFWLNDWSLTGCHGPFDVGLGSSHVYPLRDWSFCHPQHLHEEPWCVQKGEKDIQKGCRSHIPIQKRGRWWIDVAKLILKEFWGEHLSVLVFKKMWNSMRLGFIVSMNRWFDDCI